jgi:hypothetical protein
MAGKDSSAYAESSGVPVTSKETSICRHKADWRPGQRMCQRCHAAYQKIARLKKRKILEAMREALIDALIMARQHERDSDPWYGLAVEALKQAGFDEFGMPLAPLLARRGKECLKK